MLKENVVWRALASSFIFFLSVFGLAQANRRARPRGLKVDAKPSHGLEKRAKIRFIVFESARACECRAFHALSIYGEPRGH